MTPSPYATGESKSFDRQQNSLRLESDMYPRQHSSKNPAPVAGFMSRRQMLVHGGAGFGALALASLLPSAQGFCSDVTGNHDSLLAANSLAAKVVHHPARAKSVIFLFMEGGPSHLDTFDPKPMIQQLAGKPLPSSFARIITAMGEFDSPVLPSQRKWQQHGQSGLWISDWLPQIAKHADELAVIRSCWTNGINHSGGVCQMNSGSQFAGRPSLGSWVTYGLGTENENLPAFVVMQDTKATVTNGSRNWSAGFMPALYQGTAMQVEGDPFPNLSRAGETSPQQQRLALDYLQQINSQHRLRRTDNSDLEARIGAFELAYQMQSHAPEAVDLSQESSLTHQMYGLDNPKTAAYGRNCLLARRLVERGVRFVQCYHGAGSKWDAHSKIESNHTKMCGEMDQPVAALLTDLKQRGLLDQTLVLWGGEFGRTPQSEKGDGRDHNPTGFTMWMAGGGVRGGTVIGATDEVGLHAVEERLHVHDLHNTVLHLMGVDHRKLVYLHKGRPERIDQNEGRAYTKI